MMWPIRFTVTVFVLCVKTLPTRQLPKDLTRVSVRASQRKSARGTPVSADADIGSIHDEIHELFERQLGTTSDQNRDPNPSCTIYPNGCQLFLPECWNFFEVKYIVHCCRCRCCQPPWRARNSRLWKPSFTWENCCAGIMSPELAAPQNRTAMHLPHFPSFFADCAAETPFETPGYIFQRCLHRWQNPVQCSGKHLAHVTHFERGLGVSFLALVKSFIHALAGGRIWAPVGPWLHAKDSQSCNDSDGYLCFFSP